MVPVVLLVDDAAREEARQQRQEGESKKCLAFHVAAPWSGDPLASDYEAGAGNVPIVTNL
jgi:hypothetical protein